MQGEDVHAVGLNLLLQKLVQIKSIPSNITKSNEIEVWSMDAKYFELRQLTRIADALERVAASLEGIDLQVAHSVQKREWGSKG